MGGLGHDTVRAAPEPEGALEGPGEDALEPEEGWHAVVVEHEARVLASAARDVLDDEPVAPDADAGAGPELLAHGVAPVAHDLHAGVRQLPAQAVVAEQVHLGPQEIHGRGSPSVRGRRGEELLRFRTR